MELSIGDETETQRKAVSMSKDKERLQINVPVHLADKLREIAMALDVSLTQLVVNIIKEKLKIK